MLRDTTPKGPRLGTAAGEGWVRAYTLAAPSIAARQTDFTVPGAIQNWIVPGQYEDGQ